MKLPLIAFLLILAAIVFFKWRQFPKKKKEKEREEGLSKKDNVATGIKIAVIAVGIIFVSAVIFKEEELFWEKPREGKIFADYPLCAGPAIYDLRTNAREAAVELSPNCWSGQVLAPMYSQFVVDTFSPGDLEYKFLDGTRILVPDKSAISLDRDGNFRRLNYLEKGTFRLRGNGSAKVVVYKIKTR